MGGYRNLLAGGEITMNLTKLRIRLAVLVASLIGGEVYTAGLIAAMAANQYCLKTLTAEERFRIYQEYRESISEIYKKW